MPASATHSDETPGSAIDEAAESEPTVVEYNEREAQPDDNGDEEHQTEADGEEPAQVEMATETEAVETEHGEGGTQTTGDADDNDNNGGVALQRPATASAGMQTAAADERTGSAGSAGSASMAIGKRLLHTNTLLFWVGALLWCSFMCGCCLDVCHRQLLVEYSCRFPALVLFQQARLRAVWTSCIAAISVNASQKMRWYASCHSSRSLSILTLWFALGYAVRLSLCRLFRRSFPSLLRLLSMLSCMTVSVSSPRYEPHDDAFLSLSWLQIFLHLFCSTPLLSLSLPFKLARPLSLDPTLSCPRALVFKMQLTVPHVLLCLTGSDMDDWHLPAPRQWRTSA